VGSDGKSKFWVDKVIPEILVTGLELLSIAVVVPDTNVSWAIGAQSVKSDNGITSYIVSLEESGILGGMHKQTFSPKRLTRHPEPKLPDGDSKSKISRSVDCVPMQINLSKADPRFEKDSELPDYSKTILLVVFLSD
jgi:hypothetical protein